MRKSLLIGSAFLLTTAAVGVALAASEFPLLHHHEHRHDAGMQADRGPTLRVADGREREYRRVDRHRHDDDEEHEDEHGEGRRRMSATGPANPNAPLPDNGLFGSKARPQVEVR